MTSSSIQDVSGIYYARRTKGTQNGTSDTDDISGMFQNAMNMAKDQSVSGMADNRADAGKTPISGDTKTVYGMTQNTSRTYPFSNGQKTQAATSRTEGDGSVVSDDARTKETGSDDVSVKDNSDAENKIVKKIADKLQVSEDDVRAAMEELGLSFSDLSVQSNVALLVTQLVADGDSVAMLTDANLFATIRELGTEIADMLEGFAEVLPEQVTDPNALEEPVETADAFGTQAGDEAADVVSGTKDTAVTYEINGKTDADGTVDETVDTDVLAEDDADTVSDDKPQSQTGAGDSTGQSMQGHTDAASYALPSGQTNVQMMGETVPEQMSFSSDVNVQDMIDQIAERVKINLSQNFSEIEISLHPASLGNVHLQLSEKAGVISAVITTENEVVRDALAVQAISLKEELNEQGLKVDSVEVAIASHGFEHNMQKESGEEAREQYEQQVNRQSRRRIMLSGLEEAQEMLADENLTDAERIQIDMMSKNGSSMDVMA